MAQAPLDRSLARPTDAPPLAHEAAGRAAPVVGRRPPRRPLLPPEELPRHVAIIMDGNRRWARAARPARLRGPRRRRRGDPRAAPARGPARRADADAVRVQPRELGPLRRGGRRPVRAPRPAIRDETDELRAPRASGSASSAGSRSCRTRRATSIGGALDRTAAGTRLHLNIAWNYAGRTELVDAFRRIAASRASPPDEVDERTISEALYTGGLPDPDLVIRTGGEQRISNFLIWQSAYAELVFDECLWPDFGPDAFDEALLEFARRTRRFGR